MRKGRLFVAMLCLLVAGTLHLTARAAVKSTTEAAGGEDTIYVAGNPDWYPIEYYDPDTGCYQGVLPQVLERVSEKTGLRFTYIRAGEEDQRLRLAQNCQVEMVSGIAGDSLGLEEQGLAMSTAALVVPGEGSVQVRLAFTKIAGDELVETVNAALAEISQQETGEIVLRFMMANQKEPVPKWLLVGGAVLTVLLVAAVMILILWLRKYRKAARQNENFDQGTGVGNKQYFAEQFEKNIPDQYRELYCVAFIGFDIARVNQYYGEAEAEDQLLFAANELMLSTADNEIVARVSGGGFAVARLSVNEQAVSTWAEELLGRLNRYTEKHGKDYHPDFHMGIYLLRSSDRDSEQVLFNARQGYHQAVNRNLPYVFSQTDQLKRESEALLLKKQTQEAIQNREFRMYLQFVVSKDKGAISGAEALSRWAHPQKGLLYPGSYIELMESDRTISVLDFYIFEEVCRQLERWQMQGKRLSISCNFARVTIDHESFIPHLQKIVEQYHFERSRLVIEITEDAMENDKEIAFVNISQCKEMGFRIALDDVGSGYTSFSDLRDYPIDIVKIDRSILTAAVNQRGIALLKGMISLAHSMQMEVLCEGVETADQADLLRQLGCDYMQGYYYYRGIPSEEANQLLREKAI